MSALKDQALLDFLALTVRGFTLRRIKQKMEKKGHSVKGIPDSVLIQIQLSHGAEVNAQREELDRSTLEDYGLARKMERIRRLCEAAEAVEPLIGGSPKWSGEYRRFLAQIQAELEPLGIEVSPSDKWADLLMRLANVDQSDVGTEKPAP